MSLTLFEKLWQIHEIKALDARDSLLNIDRIFLHERTGSLALLGLEASNHPIANPSKVYCTMDHIVSTKPGRNDTTEMPGGQKFLQATRAAANKAQIQLFDLSHPYQGIVHVISPELGIALPGSTLVCPDSHTCTLGGIGALAWGIGSTQAEHALATNTLRVAKPKTMMINCTGSLREGVSAKDLIIHIIGHLGTAAGSGYAIEFGGQAISELAVEGRLTVCNMAVELSAFTGVIAPDHKTFAYLQDKPYAPKGNRWTQALEHWSELHSDPGATFDRIVTIQCHSIKPSVTWGTSPQDAVAVDGVVPHPKNYAPQGNTTQEAMARALTYMDLTPDTPMRNIQIDAAFIGSCTNSRISDLREVAKFLEGRQVAPGVSAICVPGSNQVKRQAEAEGLDKILTGAGFEWRESGCSMCFYAGGETFGPGKRVISSTNRNFEGRQGIGTRTHLASPLTVAASACSGYITSAYE